MSQSGSKFSHEAPITICSDTALGRRRTPFWTRWGANNPSSGGGCILLFTTAAITGLAGRVTRKNVQKRANSLLLSLTVALILLMLSERISSYQAALSRLCVPSAL